MTPDDTSSQQDMIEYVLGSQDAGNRAAIEARMAEEPELANRVEALRRVLTPLDAWTAPEPSTSLVDNILQRIESTSPLRYVASSTALSPEPAGSGSRRGRIPLREIVAIAACIGLLLTVFLPGIVHTHRRRQQAMCNYNLAGFGQGVSQYMVAHDGAFPSVGGTTNVNWLQQPNRRHLAPMVRLRFVVPRNVFCPSTPDGTVDREAAIANVRQFLKRVNIRFYSPQNMNGPVQLLSARMRMPLAADPNPMFENGVFRSTAGRLTNSQAHDGRGQNVLFTDGSARFLRTPVIGEREDNIWKAENVQRYTGLETQQSATDAFLIP